MTTMGIYVVAFIIFLIVSAITWAKSNIAIVIGVVIIAIFIAISIKILNSKKKSARLAYLAEKYKSQEIAEAIMAKRFWVGQNQEQLVDSLGETQHKDRKALKTKTKEIWKYNEVRKNQFAVRITLENGVVSSYDKKS